MTQMTSKLNRRTKPDAAAATPPPAGHPSPVPEPPRLRRRPLVVVAGVLAVCMGALAGVWVWTVGTTQSQVVALRQSVQRGAVIQVTDLMQVRMGLDPAIKTVPAAQLNTLVGKRAAQDMAAGSLVNPAQVTDSVVPASGSSLVGLQLTSAQMPAARLVAGDQVRIVSTPAKGAAVTGEAVVVTATVQDVTALGDAKTGNAQTVVDVLVPASAATDLAARAATGNVALVLDARER